MAHKIPVVDTGRCTLCGGCLEVAPEIFHHNEELGFIEVIDREDYPPEIVDEAIKICPVDCIEWSDESG